MTCPSTGQSCIWNCTYIHSQPKAIIALYSDTVSRSGVYCAVSNAVEQCKTEGVADVFQVTKAVRMQKPGAVATLSLVITNSNS